MNDHELDRLVASAAPVHDGWVAKLDLGDAETELMEEIMATTDTPVPLPSDLSDPSGPSGPPHEPSEPATGPSSAAGGPPRRVRLAVAVGVAAALLAGGLMMRSTMGDDGSDVRATGERTIMPMIVDPIPTGFEVELVMPEQGLDTSSDPADGSIDTRVYGDLTETALTNDVLIDVSPRAPAADMPSEPVTVRGRPGQLCSPGPNECRLPYVTTVSWTEAAGVNISVTSRAFDRSELLAIAEGVVVDGDRVELGSVPAGVRKPPLAAELDTSWDALLYTVTYVSDEASISVATQAETEATRVYSLWFFGPRDELEIHGHPASFSEIDGGHVLTWEPAPGQLLQLNTSGLDEATTRDIAESLRPATEAEWTRLQDQVLSEGSFGVDPRPADAVHRTLANGTTEVWGWRGDGGRLCFEEAVESGAGSRGCGGNSATKVVRVSPTTTDGQLNWDIPVAMGLAPEGTASIDGGQVTLGEPVDGERLFVWESSNAEMPESLTFRDADGNEIATEEVDVS